MSRSSSAPRPPSFQEDGTIHIHLAHGRIAVIDGCDAHLARFKWTAIQGRNGCFYAQRELPRVNGIRQRSVLLHREVLGLPGGRIPLADHIDGDGLNCRRANLRKATVTENNRNRFGANRNNKTSGELGISFHKPTQKWRAHISHNHRHIHLGLFETKDAAAQRRLEAEREIWGVTPRRTEAHRPKS